MTGRRAFGLLRVILLAAVAFLIGLHAVPATYLLPVLAMVITFGALIDDRMRLSENERKLEAEREKLRLPADGHRVRVDSGGTLRPAGERSLAELREKRQAAWDDARRSVTTARCADFTAKLKAIRELDEQIRAMEATAPVVTPMLKSQPLPPLTDEAVRQLARRWREMTAGDRAPLVLAPPVSGSAPGYSVFGQLVTREEFEAVRRQLSGEAEPEPAVAEEAYTPAGEAEMLAELLRNMRAQVAEATRTPWAAGRRREWHVSPEWMTEVRKLRGNGGSGRLLLVPRTRQAADSLPGTLLGYPVVVSDQFGVPELTCA